MPFMAPNGPTSEPPAPCLLSFALGNKALCPGCSEKSADIYARILAKRNNFERLYARVWTQCQRCQGSLHQDVLCTRCAMQPTMWKGAPHDRTQASIDQVDSDCYHKHLCAGGPWAWAYLPLDTSRPPLVLLAYPLSPVLVHDYESSSIQQESVVQQHCMM